MALWKICVLRANDDPRWQTIHSFWVRIFSFQIQFIRSPEMLYSILILRENWIVDARMEKMLFESSFYGRDYGQNLCFFQKKKKKEMPTYLLKFWIWKNGNQEIFLSWPYLNYSPIIYAIIFALAYGLAALACGWFNMCAVENEKY